LILIRSQYLEFAQNFDIPQTILPSKFTFDKIQNGSSDHFEIHFNGHNSVTIGHIDSKFSTETKTQTQIFLHILHVHPTKFKVVVAAIL